MKQKWTAVLLTLALMLSVFPTVLVSEAAYTDVASASDMTTVEEVGVEGMEPISGTDVKDGTYDVTVETSSSMFKIDKAVLNVENGAMTAKLTISSNSYKALFAGTGAQAAKSKETTYLFPETDADGNQVYTFPVTALDEGLSCAAYSNRKEQWYDRQILFRADSLPEGAVLVALPDYAALEEAAKEERIASLQEESGSAEAVKVDLKDGDYTAEVTLEGGSGKASITSPAKITVKDGAIYADIEWSSPHYDYMIVGGEKFLPEKGTGTGDVNSVFRIPVLALGQPFAVKADTTAMSKPHEIDYTITVKGTLNKASKGGSKLALILVAAAALILLAALLLLKLGRGRGPKTGTAGGAG